MHVQSVQLDSFRNLQRQIVQLHEGVNLLIGDNGQGKTNLLEAIHLIASLRSFRQATVRELIRRDGERAEIAVTIRKRGVPLNVRLSLDRSGRRLWVGQRAVSAVSDYLGQLNVVAFTPDDLAMVKGAPVLRRRYMDRAAFFFQPSHLLLVRNFTSALRARNRLLHTGTEVDRLQLESFTDTVARFGSQLSSARCVLISRLHESLARILHQLSDGALQARIEYRPGWNMDAAADAGALRDRLREQLNAQLARDRKRGSTSVGPQQDDFEVLLHNASARRYASQGQQRACAVALLLAVVEEVVTAKDEQPVLLLDDVSSELDADTRRRLFKRVRSLGGQVLVTTTDPGLLAELQTGSERRFSVRSGLVEALEGSL